MVKKIPMSTLLAGVMLLSLALFVAEAGLEIRRSQTNVQDVNADYIQITYEYETIYPSNFNDLHIILLGIILLGFTGVLLGFYI